VTPDYTAAPQPDSERFQFFPFAVRALPKLGEAKLGLKECEDHGLIVRK
jgi:hypothetical protein